MKKLLSEKLNSSKGESIAEVLIAVLIIAVSLVLLSSLIVASTHIMDKGDKKVKEIYAGTNFLEAKDGSGTARVLRVKSEQLPAKDMRINVSFYKDPKSLLKAYYIKQ